MTEAPLSLGWEYADTPIDMGGFEICDLIEAAIYINELRNKYPELIIGVTSGGYDPVHPGHISCILDSKLRCDKLFVVVNGDEFIRRKKNEHEPFQPLMVRTQNVSAIKGVDVTIPFNASDPADLTVCEALRVLQPHIFFKGGDRSDIENLPETPVCKQYGIEIIGGMGDTKKWSSSDFTRKWDERIKNGQKEGRRE